MDLPVVLIGKKIHGIKMFKNPCSKSINVQRKLLQYFACSVFHFNQWKSNSPNFMQSSKLNRITVKHKLTCTLIHKTSSQKRKIHLFIICNFIFRKDNIWHLFKEIMIMQRSSAISQLNLRFCRWSFFSFSTQDVSSEIIQRWRWRRSTVTSLPGLHSH